MFRIVSASGGEVPGAVMGLAKQKAAQLVRIGKRPAKNAVAYSAYPDELYIGVIQLGQTAAGDLIIVLLQRTDPDTGNPTTGKITKSHIAAGGFVFGGAATVNMVANHIASGGFVFGGSAAVNKVANHIAAGGFVFGGAATVAVTFASITVTVTVSGYVTYGSPLSTVVSATESPFIAGTWLWSRSLSTSNLPVGTYDISATYTPTDTAYAAAWDGDWITVIQKALSITADNMSKTYGDADPSFTYSSSGLVSGDGISGALARTSGSDVGTYSISIGTLSAGGNYSTSFTGATLTINKANQVLGTVTTVWTAGAGNPAIGGREGMIGDTAVVTVSSQGASGNAVTYTSSNTGVCTVSGTTLTIVGIGSFTITAHQAGNSNYNAAADKSNSALNTVKTPATVSSANASVTYNGSPQSAAGVTSPADLSVNYTYNGSSTIPTNAGTYTVVGTINDTRYTGSGSWTLTINKANQSISAIANISGVYGGNFTQGFIYTSAGLSATLRTSNAGICNVSDNAYQTQGVVGSCILYASHAGDGNYNAVTEITLCSVTISKANQAAVSCSVNDYTLTTGQTATATGSGGSGSGGWTYQSSNSSIATVNSSGVVTAVAAGTVSISAYKYGDGNYNDSGWSGWSSTVTVAAGLSYYVVKYPNAGANVWGIIYITGGVQYPSSPDVVYNVPGYSSGFYKGNENYAINNWVYAGCCDVNTYWGHNAVIVTASTYPCNPACFLAGSTITVYDAAGNYIVIDPNVALGFAYCVF